MLIGPVLAELRSALWQRALRYLMRKLEVEAKNLGKEAEFFKMLWEVRAILTPGLRWRGGRSSYIPHPVPDMGV